MEIVIMCENSLNDEVRRLKEMPFDLQEEVNDLIYQSEGLPFRIGPFVFREATPEEVKAVYVDEGSRLWTTCVEEDGYMFNQDNYPYLIQQLFDYYVENVKSFREAAEGHDDPDPFCWEECLVSFDSTDIEYELEDGLIAEEEE